MGLSVLFHIVRNLLAVHERESVLAWQHGDVRSARIALAVVGTNVARPGMNGYALQPTQCTHR